MSNLGRLWLGGAGLAFAFGCGRVTGVADGKQAGGAGGGAEQPPPAVEAFGGEKISEGGCAPPGTGGVAVGGDAPIAGNDAPGEGGGSSCPLGGCKVGGSSCDGLPATCGASGNRSCCASSDVPGGTFNRSNDPLFPATVGSFKLDDYEVTVGRFRNFVAHYRQDMLPAGAGKNPRNPQDSGWRKEWDAQLPLDTEALLKALTYNSFALSWTDLPNSHENRPINDVPWLEAFAFCAWDGGRLPTEAEWNYAAAGGDEQREVAWPGNDVSPDIAASNCACVDVGSKSPQSDARWGQADLTGSLREWTFDGWGNYPVPCVDCANPPDGMLNAIRPGNAPQDTSSRDSYSGAPYVVGFRCARD